MIKVIDGKDTVLGRLATYVAKQALKGEEFAIVNCDDVIITGNKGSIKEHYEGKRKRVGSGQQGPKISRDNYRIVKRAIRGMIPNHRKGMGKEAFKRVKCYNGVPKEFEGSDKVKIDTGSKRKSINVREIFK